MDGLICDACGGGLLVEDDVRYVLRIEGFAAYDPMEITKKDLERDLEAEMKRLIEALGDLDADEAQDQVHRAFRFDLCPRCWRRFLKSPLAGAKDRGEVNEKKKSQGD